MEISPGSNIASVFTKYFSANPVKVAKDKIDKLILNLDLQHFID